MDYWEPALSKLSGYEREGAGLERSSWTMSSKGARSKVKAITSKKSFECQRLCVHSPLVQQIWVKIDESTRRAQCGDWGENAMQSKCVVANVLFNLHAIQWNVNVAHLAAAFQLYFFVSNALHLSSLFTIRPNQEGAHFQFVVSLVRVWRASVKDSVVVSNDAVGFF